MLARHVHPIWGLQACPQPSQLLPLWLLSIHHPSSNAWQCKAISKQLMLRREYLRFGSKSHRVSHNPKVLLRAQHEIFILCFLILRKLHCSNIVRVVVAKETLAWLLATGFRVCCWVFWGSEGLGSRAVGVRWIFRTEAPRWPPDQQATVGHHQMTATTRLNHNKPTTGWQCRCWFWSDYNWVNSL